MTSSAGTRVRSWAIMFLSTLCDTLCDSPVRPVLPTLVDATTCALRNRLPSSATPGGDMVSESHSPRNGLIASSMNLALSSGESEPLILSTAARHVLSDAARMSARSSTRMF